MSNIIDLSAKRPPVHFSLAITHHWDDRLEVTAYDVGDDDRSKASIADTLTRASRMFGGKAPEPPPGTWQTVETAPKDGQTFLTFSDDGAFDFAEWDAEYGQFCKHSCGWQHVTHWRTLDAPEGRSG